MILIDRMMNAGFSTRDKCCLVEFSEVYKLYYQPLVYFATRMITDRAEAEDIATEIFMKYWAKKEDFASEMKVKAYLYISAKNACLNLLDDRRQLTGKNRQLSLLSDDRVDPVLHVITKRELLTEAQGIMESLPAECRKIIKLTFKDGKTNQTIARQLQISVHTVKNQKSRGIRIMKERFAKLQSG